MLSIEEVMARIGPPDEGAMARARERETMLTKPAGSLGRLEELALQLAGIVGTERPRLAQKAIVIMAADHGVTAEGVSAYPAEVTPQMVANFLAGGAAINALARGAGARVTVVDLGVRGAIPEVPEVSGGAAGPTLLRHPLGPGTANAAHGPAMARETARQGLAVGIRVAEGEVGRGLDLLGVGEMGIGNTTAASAIVVALTGLPPERVTGHGTGVTGAAYERKIAVVRQMLVTNRPDPADPLDVLAKVGGFEIAGLVGLLLGTAAARVPIILDGFITGAAALVAVALCPALRPYLIAAHRSAEPGHAVVLDALGLTPLLDFGLRLGEGSGAALAFGLVDGAARHLAEMATFAEAGVSEES